MESVGEDFKSELAEFLAVWNESDLRVTHGRASSILESEHLVNLLGTRFKDMTEKCHENPDEQFGHDVSSDRYSLVH